MSADQLVRSGQRTRKNPASARSRLAACTSNPRLGSRSPVAKHRARTGSAHDPPEAEALSAARLLEHAPVTGLSGRQTVRRIIGERAART